MTPPGSKYDYFEGQSFKARTKDLPDLAGAVEAHVRRHFDTLESLNEIDANTKVGELTFRGQRFGYAVIKIGVRKLLLQQLWNAESENLDLEQLKKSLILWRKK